MDNTYIATAKDNGTLVGYAIAVQSYKNIRKRMDVFLE